jgi:hypothetical protein
LVHLYSGDAAGNNHFAVIFLFHKKEIKKLVIYWFTVSAQTKDILIQHLPEEKLIITKWRFRKKGYRIC